MVYIDDHGECLDVVLLSFNELIDTVVSLGHRSWLLSQQPATNAHGKLALYPSYIMAQ